MPKKKADLEIRILEAKVNVWEGAAQLMNLFTGFAPRLIKRIVEEFEEDFKVPFNKKPIVKVHGDDSEGGSGGDHTFPFNKAKFEKAPCYLCGYNGPNYFQPDTHPCAKMYHQSK